MNDTTFQRKLISIMKDNMFDRFIGNKKSGKLNTKKLYKVDSSSKLFKKKEERKGKHYNITILVDCSGSMSRGKSKYASEATGLLVANFEKAKLNYQVYGFNSDLKVFKNFNKKPDVGFIKRNIISFAETRSQSVVNDKQEMYNPEFHKKDYSSIPIYGEYNCGAGNFDGFWINEMVRQVSVMKGKNILIVLSDGAPAHDYGDFLIPKGNGKMYLKDYDLKKVVKSAINKGITFLGIGINTDSVRSYYPKNNTIVIHDLSNLYSEIVGKLNLLIKRG